ncbi:hypothetical protein FOPG_19095 [Fusarium oxysporum f. sp. conglutinans race 2 54008]|uniref:Uncharacterized protein n=2 Tax=Fusarium oxysporum TaxID=5507 RepID=X0GXL7_FUSOX|nr:hypothetical protein FOVG_19835 [Fusarium oxysporum f. sp. pisi HDV247]EXL64650.1 hypothetical protein FOPG_19095 [Fusarium oxysporum f. sp. conglutinans race 2 54008]
MLISMVILGETVLFMNPYCSPSHQVSGDRPLAAQLLLFLAEIMNMNLLPGCVALSGARRD